MSDYITVVTNPELGWDCVVAVYDHNTSERSIKKEHGKDVVLHTTMISNIPDKVNSNEVIILDDIQTLKDSDFFYDEGYYYIFEENLKVINDDYSLMEALDQDMTEKDQKTLLRMFQEFLSEKYPDFVLNAVPFVLSNKGGKYFTSELKFNTEDELDSFNQWHGTKYEEFANWLWDVKSIKLF